MMFGTRLVWRSRYPAPAPRWPYLASLTAALYITVLLSLAMSAPPSASQVAQDSLSVNIDPTVSPREDFFRYAGGEWLRRNPIPEDQARWGIWNVASDEIYARLRTICEKAAARRAARGSAEQLVGDVWATGMDSAAINKQGLAPLKPDLDRIGEIRSVRDLIDVVAMLHRRNMLVDSFFVRQRVLFDDGVERDEVDSNRRVYGLSQGGLTMGRLAYSATNPSRVKVQNAFREYLFRTFLRLHGDRGKARASADAVYDLEARLAAGFEQGDMSRRMRTADLGQLAPTINWNRYFQQIGATRIDSVEVRQPGFFRALDSLLRAASLETWKDYLRFWLIKVNAPFLDDGTYGEFFAYKSAVTGQLQPEPRWRRVVWQLKNWLGLPLAKLYVDAEVPPNTRSRYRAVAEAIREAFRERVEHSDWISDSTKDSAILKLDRLRITIGYPGGWVDFRTMPLRRDAYVLNMIRSAEWFHNWEIKSLNRAVGKGEVDLHPSIGSDAEYLVSSNEVRVSDPAPPGLRGQQLDDAFVYGATWLGHEIAHALDSEGRHYDADGSRVDWWTAADVAAFEERARALVDQYNELIPLEGLHIDGRGTLRENMADLVGLRIALDAFKKTDQFKKNERVGGFTPLQRFFSAYAYARMGHERPESLATRLRGRGAYAPDRERVNGAVMNIPEFYEAFNVQPGDPMYRPERARVKIW
jgi:putative endopeptidase